MSISRLLASFTLLLVVSSSSHAESELRLFYQYTVPGLDSPIEKIKLADIDGDDFAEALACDGHNLVLLALPNNIMLSDTLEERFSEYEIELADVNRDSVTDITIGLFHKINSLDGPENRLVFYDSALLARRLPDLVYNDPTDARCNSIEQSSVAAVDLNGDGYNELLFSFEKSEKWYAYASCRTIGYADVFYSYPDSMLAHHDVHLDGAWLLPNTSSGAVLISHRIIDDYAFWVGPDWDKSHQIVYFIRSDGTGGDLFWWPYHSSGCLDDGSGERSAFNIGSVVTVGETTVTIGSYSYSAYCNQTSYHVEGAGLAAAAVYSTDSTELLWDNSVAGDFSNFITHPSFPDRFFVMLSDTLMQYSIIDGSLQRRYADPLPVGMKFWDYPYGGIEPYLVVVNDRTVTYYQFAEVTHVGDDATAILPSDFTVDQPYPNPFNPSVTIPINTSRAGHLKIEVFNPLGQRVSLLADGLVRPGKIELEWDGTEFASGVYFFHVSFDDQTQIEKAVLLK